MLEASGERVIPDLQREELVYAEHLARYRLAAQCAPGKRVLDAASGEGYGAAMMMAAGAASVVGIDIDPDVVEHSRRRYGLEVVQGDVRELPFPDGSFDLVVSFETIEHVPDPERAVAEFRRVLVDDGLLVISTPNADEYLVENEFHQTELSTTELLELLAPQFSAMRRLYQQNWLLSAIVDEHQLRSADVDRPLRAEVLKAVGLEPGRELYSVVVCGPLSARLRSVAVVTGVYEAHRMAADVHKTRDRLAEGERELAAWQARSLEAERQREEVEREQIAWQARALEAERQVEAWKQRALASEFERDAAQTSVRAMETSRSWRLTRPLRAASQLARNGRSNDT